MRCTPGLMNTLHAIVDYGQQDLGMPPYGLAYGGELKKSEIDAVVLYMRYTWDDRAELPADAASAGAIPALAGNGSRLMKFIFPGYQALLHFLPSARKGK